MQKKNIQTGFFVVFINENFIPSKYSSKKSQPDRMGLIFKEFLGNSFSTSGALVVTENKSTHIN